MARIILNGYLGLFAIDGVLQAIGLVITPLMALAMMSRGIVMLATLALVGSWVVFARLPWRMVLPVVLLAWQTGGMMPLPALMLDLGAVSWVGALTQIALALALVGFRPDRFPVSEEAMGDGPEVRLPVSVGRVLVLGVTLVLGTYLQFIAMAAGLSIITDGYVQVDRTGLSTAHRACTRGDTTVHLVGAVHIGESKGYEQLMAGIPEGSLLLAEGVSDEDGLLGDRFGYGKLAKRLGLVPQRAAGKEAEDEGEGRFRVQRADVDVNTFDEATLKLLRDVGAILNAEDPVVAYVQSVGEMTGVTEETLKTVIDDVLIERNKHLLVVLDEVLPNERVVIIPWGAMHLRDVGRAVQERGFTCGEPRLIRMIEWATVGSALRGGAEGRD